MLKGFAYLRSTLLPLMETIQPTMTQSFILDILGESDRISLQSILIAAGGRVEEFWNIVISDCAEENLIADKEIDQGIIISQAPVRRMDSDTLEIFTQKIQAAEHVILPTTIANLSLASDYEC